MEGYWATRKINEKPGGGESENEQKLRKPEQQESQPRQCQKDNLVRTLAQDMTNIRYSTPLQMIAAFTTIASTCYIVSASVCYSLKIHGPELECPNPGA